MITFYIFINYLAIIVILKELKTNLISKIKLIN